MPPRLGLEQRAPRGGWLQGEAGAGVGSAPSAREGTAHERPSRGWERDERRWESGCLSLFFSISHTLRWWEASSEGARFRAARTTCVLDCEWR